MSTTETTTRREIHGDYEWVIVTPPPTTRRYEDGREYTVMGPEEVTYRHIPTGAVMETWQEMDEHRREHEPGYAEAYDAEIARQDAAAAKAMARYYREQASGRVARNLAWEAAEEADHDGHGDI